MKRWPTKPLGEVCFVNPKLAAFDAPSADVEVTFVPMAAVDEVSGTIAQPERRRYSEVAKGYTPFKENDVLFAKITPCMQNGKAAVASNLCGGFGFGSTEFHVLRSAGSVLPRWVFAFIRQPAFRSAAEASFTGSAGQQRVPADFLKTFPIPIPPLAEQERLVKLLNEVDELRKLRTKADNRTAALVPSIFDEYFGDPATNPKRWPKKPLLDACDFQGGTQPPKSTFIYKPSADYIRLIQIRDFESDATPVYVPVSPNLKTCREFDVMIARYGASLGRILRGKSGAYNVALVKTIPNKSFISGDFLFYWLASEHFQDHLRKAGRRAAQAGFNKEDIAQLKIILPPLPLQKKFAARVSEIRAMQAEQAASRSHLDDLFQSMLHRAFNGEL